MSDAESVPLVFVGPNGVRTAVLWRVAEAIRHRRASIDWERSWRDPDGDQADEPVESFELQGLSLLDFARAQGAPVDVFAWSSGAFTALHAATEDPSAFRKLYLYEPPYRSRDDATTWQRWRFFESAVMSFMGVGRASRRAFWRMVSPRDDGRCGFDRLPSNARDALVEGTGPLLLEMFAGTGEELGISLSRLTTRVLVLVGERSHATVQRAADRLVAAVPFGMVVEVRDADHLAPIAAPERVGAAILGW